MLANVAPNEAPELKVRTITEGFIAPLMTAAVLWYRLRVKCTYSQDQVAGRSSRTELTQARTEITPRCDLHTREAWPLPTKPMMLFIHLDCRPQWIPRDLRRLGQCADRA